MLPIIIPVRAQSQRCKNKCLRPFYNGLNLTEITCAKYRDNCDVFLAAHEQEFRDIANKYNIGFLQRSLRSVTSERGFEIMEYLEGFRGKRICLLSGCNPFLKAETVFKFIEASEGHKSFTMAKNCVDVIFDCDNKVVNKDLKCFNSKERKPNRIVSNSGYVFDVDFFFKNETLWDYTEDNPALFTIDHIEATDIDTELDFAIAQAIAREIK